MGRSLRVPLVLVVAVLLSILVPCAARAQWPHTLCTPVRVTTATDMQISHAVVTDGAGGAFVAWADYRNSGVTGVDIYMARLLVGGGPDPGWTANGIPVCTASGGQIGVVMIPDGEGGAILAWDDLRSAPNGHDIYAIRILADGDVAPGWPAGGLRVSLASTDDVLPKLCSDGAGGAFIVWQANLSVSNHDPMLQHLTADGQVEVGFPAGGMDLDATSTLQEYPSVAPNGTGGCIVAYQSNNAGNYDIFAVNYRGDGSQIFGASVTNATGDQTQPLVISDGDNGALVVWTDRRSGDADVYGTRLLPTGRTPAGFQSGSLLIGTGVSDQVLMELVTDGAGGGYVHWANLSNSARYVTRFTVNGTIPPGWTTSGLNVSDYYAGIAPDGTGGLLVGTQIIYAVPWRVGAHRYLPGGAAAAGWPSGGTDICSAVIAGGSYASVLSCADGKGGAIVVWCNSWDGSSYDLLAGHVDHYGYLGSPEPFIAAVDDVAHDQGGQVRVAWSPSYLDADPTYGIGSYRVWREAPAALAQGALAAGAVLIDDTQEGGEPPAASRVFRTTVEGAQTWYWELVGTQVASGLPGYSLVAPTTSDSTAAGNPLTAFMVEGMAATGSGRWTSPPVSAYSVDDLAPAVPAPFTGTYAAGYGASLIWAASPEADLAGYRLYRGSAPDFAPGPSNLVIQKADPGYLDAGAPTAYYKLSAFDIHGNESAFALLLPNGTLAVEDETPRELSLASIAPNPALGAARVGFTLPSATSVELSVFDAQGRRVRTLASGERTAGKWSEVWDGRDAVGTPVGSGLYFVRLEALGRVLTRRMAYVR